MGMHANTERMHEVVHALSRFYAKRHGELEGHQGKFAEHFDPDVTDLDDEDIDAPYFAYMEALSHGLDEVLAKLKVAIDPVPPGSRAHANDELLMAGTRMLKWQIEVKDAQSGQFLGRFEWAMYHRHDRFAVPGPAQVTYLKSRGGKTVMIS